MDRSDQYVEKCRAVLQAAIPGEQVLAVGLLATVGATKSSNMIVFPLAAFVVRRRGRRKAPGFPLLTAVAVTSTRLVCFGFRPPIRLRKCVAELGRQEWRVECVAARSRRDLPLVVLTRVDGTRLEFELRQAGRFRAVNAGFHAALSGQGTPAPV